jgi:hypothetical protein
MPGATSSLSYRDAAGAAQPVQAFDKAIAGAGSGPFLPDHRLTDSLGNPIDPAKDASVVANGTVLAAILAKLIAAPATDATLAAILAKIVAGGATDAGIAAALGAASALRDPQGRPVGRLGTPDLVTRSHLVAVPFGRTNTLALSTAGVATALSWNVQDNDDGTRGALFVSTPVAPNLGLYGGFRFWFNGSILGLRWGKQAYENNDAPFSVMIDREPFEVPTQAYLDQLYQTSPGSSDYPNNNELIIADDLADGWHECEIYCPCSLATANYWNFHGFLADPKAGYQPVVRGVSMLQSDYGRAVAASPAWTTFPSSNYFKAMRGVLFYNPTGAPIAVSCRQNSVGQNAIIWSKVVASGDTVTFDLLAPFYQPLDFQASAVGVVATLIELN